jgi:hypothetical protein
MSTSSFKVFAAYLLDDLCSLLFKANRIFLTEYGFSNFSPKIIFPSDSDANSSLNVSSGCGVFSISS